MPEEAEIWTLDKYRDVLRDMKHWRSKWTGILLVVDSGSAGRYPFVLDMTNVHGHTSMDPSLV